MRFVLNIAIIYKSKALNFAKKYLQQTTIPEFLFFLNQFHYQSLVTLISVLNKNIHISKKLFTLFTDKTSE